MLKIKKINFLIAILMLNLCCLSCGKYNPEENKILQTNTVESSVRALGGPYDFWQHNDQKSVFLKMEHKVWSVRHHEDPFRIGHFCKINKNNEVTQRYKFQDNEKDLKANWFRFFHFDWSGNYKTWHEDPFDDGYKYLTISNSSVDNGLDKFIGSDSIPTQSLLYFWKFRDHNFTRVKDFKLIQQIIDLGCNF